jgi:hypothetical protein
MAGDSLTPCLTVLRTFYHFPMMLGQSDNAPQLHPTEGAGNGHTNAGAQKPRIASGSALLLGHKTNFVVLTEHLNH